MALILFWRRYDGLPAEIRHAADRQFEKLKNDSSHPSLRFKKVAESAREQIWSVRVNDDYRALATLSGATCTWFWIGNHADYERLLRSGRL